MKTVNTCERDLRTAVEEPPQSGLKYKPSVTDALLLGKRLIFVFEGLELGGAERQGLLLARHLKEQYGAHVEFWGFSLPGRVTTLCEEAGIPWRIVSRPWHNARRRKLKGLIRFARDLRAVRPDLILPYTMTPNICCGLVWKWTGAKLCIWNQRDEGRSRLGRKAERWAVREFPLFLSNSQIGADFLIQELNVAPQRVSLLHNGVVLAPPLMDRHRWRQKLGVNSDCILACMVANLSSFKDHTTLLKAWKIVAETFSSAESKPVLVLAGHFYDTAGDVQQLAYELDIAMQVRILGQVKDVSGLLHAVDLGVFSSRLEGVPNGVLECMAAGLPVVATDISGIREAMGPDNELFLTPGGNVEALADKILHLARTASARQQIGDQNRHRVQTEFSPSRMYQRFVSVLERHLACSPGREMAPGLVRGV